MGHNAVMRTHWTPLAVTYLVLALLGLAGTAVLNVWSAIAARDLAADWFGGGPAVGSLGVDLLIVAVAASIFMIVEGRRAGVHRAWLYVVLSGITAIAFTFPLFLSARERALQRTRYAQLEERGIDN